MTEWQKLINLSPEDDSETFYKKLPLLSEGRVAKEVQRFEKYATYYKILKFHLAALHRPDANIKIKYNYRYGWHLSSCIRSLPDSPYIRSDPCNCEEEIADPEEFFYSLARDYVLRCKICKHNGPDFVTWDKDGGNNGDEESDGEESDGDESPEGEEGSNDEDENSDGGDARPEGGDDPNSERERNVEPIAEEQPDQWNHS